MGYESTIYIGTIYDYGRDGDMRCMQDVAKMEMSKIGSGHLVDVFNKHMKNYKLSPSDEKRVYIFARDGNTHITQDSYEDPLLAIPFDEVFTATKKDYELSTYRRLRILFDLLVAFELHYGEPLYVMHYGH